MYDSSYLRLGAYSRYGPENLRTSCGRRILLINNGQCRDYTFQRVLAELSSLIE